MRSVLYFAGYRVRRSLASPKFWLVILFIFGVLHFGLSGASDYLTEQGDRFQAVELFVFCCSSFYFQIYLLLGFLLLLGDAPFVEEGLSFRLLRATRRRWLAGQLLGCVCISAIYLLAVEGLFLFEFWGQTSFQNEWSDSVRLAAQVSSNSILNIQMYIYFSMRVLQGGSPYAMFGLTLLYNLLLYTFCSLLMITCNLRFRVGFGVFAVMMLEGVKQFQYYVWPNETLWYCSPFSVVCLSEQVISAKTILYTVCFLGALGGVMAALAFWQVKRAELAWRDSP